MTYDQLEHVLRKSSSFRDNKECLKLMEDILNKKEILKDSKFCSIGRHCNQKKFDFLTSLENNEVVSLHVIRLDDDEKELKCVKELPQLARVPGFYRTVYLKGAVYVLKSFFENNAMSCQKYCLTSRSWEKEIVFDFILLKCYCACAFMDHIYLIGGHDRSVRITRTCLKLNAGGNILDRISPLNRRRWDAACTVFEGRVVTSGGCVRLFRSTKSVEVS